MGKNFEFIESEKNIWGKVYTNIAYAIDEISPFIDEDDLKKRKYYTKAHVLQDYIKSLNSAEAQSNKKSFFSLFKNNNTDITLLQDYKAKNIKTFDQLKKCSNCKCLNCSSECNFWGCESCRENSLIVSCDKKKINVRKFDNFTLDLTNNDTGQSSRYKVLAVLEDCVLERQYIILENLDKSEDKMVLYYYPGIKEDTYGEITDAEEFDFVVEAFQQS
ncbi:DUF1292 domain-containing protein [Clostridium sp. SM-530-WT-3G]|uniref:DUF1292 domain-containing protein n=1 Tax=Clostridium sp. SM-530-WT-3G TaxID=2725303 RepID=UPI00145F00A6|nr:DUF1292 domain-containing protein [Clostridium sp. SM-530-WT-3G]NME83806.1 DUF1292 domain-containing protein [Clostridium sp. SM-530-WT-3G]